MMRYNIVMGFFEKEISDVTKLNNLYGRLRGMPVRSYSPNYDQSPLCKAVDQVCEETDIDCEEVVRMWVEGNYRDALEFHQDHFVIRELEKLYDELRTRGFTSNQITR